MSVGAEITKTADALLTIKPLVVESLTELPGAATPQVEEPVNPLAITSILSTIEISDDSARSRSVQDVPRYEILSQILTFPSEEKRFWWHAIAPLLNIFLQIAGYSYPLQRQYLSFYEEYIISFLGPQPSANTRLKSHLTPHYVHFETSFLSHSRYLEPLLQFRIEPIGPEVGSPLDPFNWLAPDELLSLLSRDGICPSLDWDTFKYFADEFFAPDSDVEKAMQRDEGHATSSSIFITFELNKTTFDPRLRAFCFPAPKSLFTGIPRSALVFLSIRKLYNDDMELLHALEVLENCFTSHPGDEISRPVIDMLSVDCTSTPASQIWIHAHTSNSSFSHVREIYTLGETLNSRTVWSGLQVLEDLWGLLYALKYYHLPAASWAEKEVLSPSQDPKGCVNFSFELSPGREVPEIEIQIPVWNYNHENSSVASALQNFFGSRGVELPNSNDLEEMGTPTHFSFRYTEEKGISVGMSYEPKIDS